MALNGRNEHETMEMGEGRFFMREKKQTNELLN